LHTPNTGETRWKSAGLDTVPLFRLAKLKEFESSQVISCKDHEDIETYLKVTYNGTAERGDEVEPAMTQHASLFRVEEGDIVISNIAATYGSVACVDAATAGCVVSTEYTVLRALEPLLPKVLWVLLRSKSFRSEMLLAATGANRTRVKWNLIKDIQLPKPNIGMINKLEAKLKEAEKEKMAAIEKANSAIWEISNELLLEDDKAALVLEAFKPPS